ncbi:MAG: DUF2314 domain-containing protein [Phycisphaerales bacterium]
MNRRGSTLPRILLSVVVIAALVGVRLWLRSSRTSSSSNNPNVSSFSKNDAAMNGAISKSRQNVQQFIAHLSHPGSGETAFAVKIPIRDGDTTEHFWLSGTTFDGTKFHGAIDDTPEAVTTVKLGQPVACLPSEVSDWMYVSGNHLIGGETIRVARSKMSTSERAEFDRTFPYRFD